MTITGLYIYSHILLITILYRIPYLNKNVDYPAPCHVALAAALHISCLLYLFITLREHVDRLTSTILACISTLYEGQTRIKIA